jgi:hypothetical protein
MSAGLADEIAAAAAQLVVEQGLEYGAAKRKAARDLGRRTARRGELPDNEAVEDEVRAYLELFCADTQPLELAALREVALSWMDRMAEYRPHLSGAVWRGTATRRSAVHLDLYCDDAKAAEIALVNQCIDYDSGALERPGAEPLNVLTVDSSSAALGERVTVHLLVRDFDELRGALKPDARGRSWRGDAAALRRLLATDAGASDAA